MNWKNNFPKENRYYETENGILYNGDCLDVLKKFPKQSINTIITDLPYGVTQNKIDIPIPFEEMWKSIKHIRLDNTPIVLFGQSKFFFKLCLSNEKEFKYDLVWDKELTSGFLNAKRMPLRLHEHIAVFYKKAGKYNPQMWVGKPLHSKGKAYKDKEHKNQNYGDFKQTDDTRAGETLKYPRSIIKFQKPHPSKAKHPTEKSVELLEYLIKTYSNEDDIILDFTCGSGTTLLAAEKLNRRWIGIELEEKYCEVAMNRLKGE